MISDERLREAYARGLPQGGERPPLDDVAAERLRKLVEQEGREEDRLHTIDTLLTTAEGRRELEIVWAAARAARPRRVPWMRFVAAASLFCVAGVSGAWWFQQSREDVLRGDPSPLTLMAPVGNAVNTSRFVWRALPDADHYVLFVVDSSGKEIYEANTRDTSTALPDSVRLQVGQRYLWWVQATTRMGASITAIAQPIVIVRDK